jgi:LysM repeat protein
VSTTAVTLQNLFSWSYAKGNYSIAKQYGITVEELEKNPAVVANLPIGFNYLSKELTNKVQPGDWNTAYKRYSKSTNKPAPVKYSNYEVQPKETLYSLSKTLVCQKMN